MRQNLAANQGVAGVEVMPFQPEDPLKVPDDRLPNLGHGNVPLQARLHRGLAERRSVNARLIEHVEQVEIRAHVQAESMIGDPAVHGHTDRGDARPAQEDAGMIGASCSSEHELVKDAQDGLLEAGEIA